MTAAANEKAVEVTMNQEWAKAAFAPNVGGALPFSFVYDGKSSGELIKIWRQEVKEEQVDKTKHKRTLTLSDPDTGLEVRTEAIIYTDTPGVDWTIYFTNKGDRDTPVIEQVKAIDIDLAAELQTSVVLHGIKGCYPDSWLAFDTTLGAGKEIAFTTVEGRTSYKDSPFFNVGVGDGGMIVAFGWSGQWWSTVARDKETGTVSVRGGMEFMHLRLHPGETIRSPRIMVVHYKGDEARSYNLFRHTMFAHIMPRAKGKLVTPPIVHTSTGLDECNLGTEADVLSHLDSLHGLGFEFLWLDAFFMRDGFPNGIGNYGLPANEVMPEPANFPRGLKPIADAVAQEGLKFLVWFEPERVAPGTLIAEKYPHYVISPDGNGGGLFNLGLPEAREYLTEVLDGAIKTWKLGCLRFDSNINPLPYWQHENAKDPERVGMAEIRCMEGLYRLWDDLLARNPGLFIDNCASGGMRIELETCSRAIPLWRTDCTIMPLVCYRFDDAALVNQVITSGLNRYMPFSTSGQMGATPYLFRSGVNAGIVFCEDIRSVDYPRENARKGRELAGVPIKYLYGETGYPRELLKAGVAEIKRLRKYYFGDFYNVSAVTASPHDWCVNQYHLPKAGAGIIIAFRRHKSPYGSFICDNLHAIDPEARYLVKRAHDYKPGRGVTMSGAALKQLKIEITERPGSEIIEYKRVDKK
jgi:alpha-galactosidase